MEGSTIFQIIKEEGFQVNRRKTHVIRRNGRQQVTGLVVNDKVRIPRRRRKLWRAIFHQATIDPGAFVRRTAELTGYLAFLRMVDSDDKAIEAYTGVIRELRHRTKGG